MPLPGPVEGWRASGKHDLEKSQNMSLRITASEASSVAGNSNGNKQFSASEPIGNHCKNSIALFFFGYCYKPWNQDILQTVCQFSSPTSTSIASTGAFFEATLSANRNSFQCKADLSFHRI